MTLSVVIAAGGTGGHMVPALAIADAIRSVEPGARISIVGTGRGLASGDLGSAMAGRDYAMFSTSVQPFARSARGILAPLSLLPATVQARAILRRARASVVVGMGGYPSIPVVAAARTMRVPSVVHEQNAVPGLANELAARMTPNIAVSFPSAMRAFGKRSPRLIGVPLRSSIAAFTSEAFDRQALRATARAKWDLAPDVPTLLAFGGSIGAARLNDAIVGIAERWLARTDRQIILVTGTAAHDAIAARIGRGTTRVFPFIEQMDWAYAAADVVIARAGASTVAELAATGVASVLVPLPIARRHEQDANAEELARAGAAVIVANADATSERLGSLADDILRDPARCATMSQAARTAARPNAASEMAAWVLDLATTGAARE